MKSDTFLYLYSNETYMKNCPISIKFGAFLVSSVLNKNTKFRQNWTIFRPFFGPKTQTRWVPNLKFWYFFPPIDSWKEIEFEKNPWWHSWGWFYSVSWNLGCGATPIWAGPDPKYFSHLTNSQKSLMGPSFGKIPEIEVPPVLKTWKMCLLRSKWALCVTPPRNTSHPKLRTFGLFDFPPSFFWREISQPHVIFVNKK